MMMSIQENVKNKKQPPHVIISNVLVNQRVAIPSEQHSDGA